MLAIPFDGAVELRFPVVAVCVGHATFTASFVLVPEAPVHEHSRSVAGQYDVWSSRERWRVFPEAEAVSVKVGTDQALGTRIRTPDVAHHPTADLRWDGVSHVVPGEAGRGRLPEEE